MRLALAVLAFPAALVAAESVPMNIPVSLWLEKKHPPTFESVTRLDSEVCPTTRSGMVVVRITIGTNGMATAATVQRSTLGDPTAATCVAHQLRERLRFAATPKGGSEDLDVHFFSGAPPGATREKESGKGMTATGDLSAPLVDAVIKSRLLLVLECEEAALARNASTKGEVIATFTIETGGATSHVSATATPADAALETCVVKAFGGMTFPKRAARTKVTYPIPIGM